MKKILFVFLISLLFMNYTFAGAPAINGAGLPGAGISGGDVVSKIIPSFIATLIKYIAVIAVISVMLSGIYYLTSFGVEDKAKKAKAWIIWSLAGVLLSVSAWFIINLINTVSIPNS